MLKTTISNHQMLFVFHSYVNRMFSHVTSRSFVGHSYVLVCARILSVYNRMSSVCHSYVLVCHPCVTRMSLVCTRMSPVCTRMSPVCHSYVTRMWFYLP